MSLGFKPRSLTFRHRQQFFSVARCFSVFSFLPPLQAGQALSVHCFFLALPSLSRAAPLVLATASILFQLESFVFLTGYLVTAGEDKQVLN